MDEKEEIKEHLEEKDDGVDFDGCYNSDLTNVTHFSDFIKFSSVYTVEFDIGRDLSEMSKEELGKYRVSNSI